MIPESEEKASRITEDELRIGQEEINDLTKKNIEEIDKVLQAKEKEILEV